MEHEQIGALIARRRKEKGLTQKQLAQQLGVTDKVVSKWERGGSALVVAFETDRPAQNVYVYNNIFFTQPVEGQVSYLTQQTV